MQNPPVSSLYRRKLAFFLQTGKFSRHIFPIFSLIKTIAKSDQMHIVESLVLIHLKNNHT